MTLPKTPRKRSLKSPPPDIEQEVVEIPAVQEASVWVRRAPWLIGLLVLICSILVAVIVLKKGPDEKISTVQDRSGEIEALKREAAAYRGMARIDSTEKEDYKRLANELLNRPYQNKTYYIESKKKYDAVPTDVNALSREQLRREITELVKPR